MDVLRVKKITSNTQTPEHEKTQRTNTKTVTRSDALVNQDRYEINKFNSMSYSAFGPRRLPFLEISTVSTPNKYKYLSFLIEQEEAEAERSYLGRKPIIFNRELRNTTTLTLQDDIEVMTRHVSLVIGKGNCIGTGEVASWLSKTIQNSVMREDFLSEFPLAQERRKQVKSKLSEFSSLLNQLDILRKKINMMDRHFYELGKKDNHVYDFSHLKRLKGSTLGYSVLHQVQKHGRCLVPVDFFGYESYASKEVFGHATSMLVEKLAPDSDKLVLRLFETNGAYTVALKRDAVKKKRTDVHGVERKGTIFSASDFSLEDIDYMNKRSSSGTARTMCQRAVEVNFTSLSAGNLSPESVASARTDCSVISRLMYAGAHFKIGTLQEMADTVGDCFDSLGMSYVPPQRIHAVQGTSSCELKSLTVVVAHLLADEVAYQALILMISIRARTVALVLDGENRCRYGPRVKHSKRRSGQTQACTSV